MALFLGERMVIDVINDRFLELWDRDSSVIGKPVIEALPEMEGQPYPQIMLDVFNSGETYYANEASVFLKRKGKLDEGFYNFINQAFRDGEGNIIGLVAVAHEVTEQVVARRKLEKLNADLATSESRLRVAIDATGLGTWDYELLTESLYLSDEFRLIAGIDREEAVSFSKFMEQVHPEDMEVILKWFKPSTPDDTGRFDIKYRIYRFNDHEMRWVNVKGIALFGPDGKPSRFTGTILDITEERLAEEKSLRLAAIVTSSDDAIISKTLDGIVTSWNAAAERMFGYTEAEMIGENILKIIPNDRKEEEPRIQERLRRGEPVDHFETQRLTKAGKLLDVSLTISPLKNSDGKIIGASKIARDISEQKRDEQRKNDFIGMVSHELKTPLTSLTAILQFAGMKLKKTDDKPLQNAMTRANVQVKRMTSMINGFLNVSRLESGKMHLEKRWFNLDELVREIVEETRLLVTSNEIIWAECQRTPVFADYDKISSVISNLISNAVKYSGNAEPITVSCQTVEGNATVSVADRGVGIKAEDLERVFERYYRIETELARQVSGFGIGLYLSAEIVRRHGGEIWAESALGEGSTFYFTLPEKDPNTGKE
jgi:PAS domain S-box-containing protein